MKSLTASISILLIVVLSMAIESRAGDKKMICYVSSWAVYRPNNGKFDVEDIDPLLCTQLIYAFAKLDEKTNTIQSYDPYNDLYDNWGRGAYIRFTNLKKKNRNLKTLIAIGGWNEGSIKYSKMASDSNERAKFVASAVSFLLRYGFDGLDLDWEYPADRGGVSTDKVNFVKLCRELKTAFAPFGFLLTAAVSPGKDTIDAAYAIATLSNVLDQIHIMGYDYHGTWEKNTGLNAPLYHNPNLDIGSKKFLNVNWTVNYFISNGADPSKLILGMPLYGRGFTLASAAQNGINAYAPQGIAAGPYTQENGIWGYNEICEKFGPNPTSNGWTVVRDPYYQAPYAYKSTQWIGYDDATSLALKGQYAAAMNLGGAMVWSMETDDFRGLCGPKYNLIKTIVQSMTETSLAPTPLVTESTSSTTSTTIRIETSSSSTAPADTSTSSTTTTVTNKPEVTVITSTTPASGPFVCTSAGYFADPEDCGRFYQCSTNGRGGWVQSSLRCASGTVYNAVYGVCSFSNEVPECENYNRP